MCSVWKAPATLSGIRRAFAGGSSANAASCSIVPAATIWPGPLSLAGVRPCLSSMPSTSSRSPPSTAVMPVGVAAAASAIALPRSRTRTMASSSADRAGRGRRRQLADAVARHRADGAEVVAGEQVESRDQAGGDQQRLGDLGVTDRVGIGLGAVVGEIEPGHRRQRLEAGAESAVLEPGREESRRLGALTGSDDDQHVNNSAVWTGRDLASGMHETLREFFVGFLQGTRASVRPDCRPSTSAISSVNACRGTEGV